MKTTILRTTNRKPHPLTEEAEEGRKDGRAGGGSVYETISKVTHLETVSTWSEEALPSAPSSLPPKCSPECWPGISGHSCSGLPISAMAPRPSPHHL